MAQGAPGAAYRRLLLYHWQRPFFYTGFSRGAYGAHKAGGVTLQFVGHYGSSAYVIFNADIQYKRGPKKGKALPGKQFRVGKRSNFYKFWLKSGLRPPQRLQNFHDCMGHLKGIAFAGTRHYDRFDASSIAPISVTETSLRKALLPDQSQTTTRQVPDNSQTFFPDNVSAESPSHKGFEPISTTCDSNYENKDVREYGDKGEQCSPKRPPQLQSVDEWLEDYESRVVPEHQTEPGF
jgi:hypothetical protein